MSLSAGEVKAAACGHWDFVFDALAPELREAMNRPGKHGSCPHHGGKDGFRLFKEYRETGASVCNTCGMHSDGLATLSWLRGWDFPTTVAKVADCLGLDQNTEGMLTTFETKDQFKVVGGILDTGEAPYEFVEGRSKTFFVRMNTEDQKTVVLWGKAVKAAFEYASVKTGEWAEFTKIGFRTRISKNGHPLKTSIWTVIKTLSPEEREAETNVKLRRDRQKEARIETLWNRAHALSEDTPGSRAVLAYLRCRGITLSLGKLQSGDALRVLDAEFAFEGHKKLGPFPVMVGAVRDCFGLMKTLHFTYLTPKGRKAPIRVPKKLLAMPSNQTMTGCAIPLSPVNKVLAVAEGIETALSVSTALHIPAWASISATGMSQLRIPNHVQYLLIMADKDRSETGFKAALALQKRMVSQGVDARILLPDEDIPADAKGIDWNDALVKKGPKAFILPGLND